MSTRLAFPRAIRFALLLSGLALCAPLPLFAPWQGHAHAAPAVAGSGPKATLQRLNSAVDKNLRTKTELGSPEDKRVKNEIKEHASELLDYTELCKRALGEHWDKMAEKQRTEFVATLKELIERNYVKQLRTNLDYDVNYGEESINGQEAKVVTTIKLRTKGKLTDAQIEYRMISGAAGWKVYDVITDELSLVRNYRSQFQRIIAGQGYDGLITKMKTKLTEERAAEAKEEKERAAKKG